MFFTRLLRVTKNEKQPECPTPGDVLNTTWWVYVSVEYNAAKKSLLMWKDVHFILSTEDNILSNNLYYNMYKRNSIMVAI